MSLLDVMGGNRLDPEVVRVMQALHEDQARLLGRELGLLLGGDTPLHVSLSGIRQSVYREVERVPERALRVPCTVAPLNTEALWVMPVPLVLAITDVLQGGDGRVEVADLTETDLKLVRRFVDRLVETWRAAWTPALGIQPHVSGAGRNVFGAIAGPEDRVLLISMEIRGDVWPTAGSESVVLCLPLAALEPHLTAFSRAGLRERTKAEAAAASAGAALADRVPLDLVVYLPLAAPSMAELLALRPGVVLDLAGAPDVGRVEVGGAHLLQCRIRERTSPTDGRAQKVITQWEVAGAMPETGSLWSEALEGRVETRVRVELRAVLGSTRITLSDLRALAPEMEVTLDQEISTPITLLANGVAVAEGKVVAIGERIGVRITRLLGVTTPDE